jgi:Family of unknown function (DUF6152)
VNVKFAMVFALSVGSVIFSAPLFGHHGGANFENKTVTVKGTVVEWFWANPHCVLKFDEKAGNGEMRHWVAETQAPNFILDVDSRWSKNSFKRGDQVTVSLRPAKDGQFAGSLTKVALPDGTELLAFGKPATADGATSPAPPKQ